MKKLAILLLGLLALAACRQEPAEPAYVVQVSLGAWNAPQYTADEIINRLETVSSRIPVQKVIIGWSLDQDIYRRVGEFLHARGIQMFFWLPVFAETEDVCENTPAVDLWGNIPANYDLAEGEGFRFSCPTDPDNAAHVVAVYDRWFGDCGFDGVFMDRIRTQSFVGGVSGVLSCGCPLCAERYAAEGVDLEAVKAAWEAKGDDFLSVTGYTPESGFQFADPLAADFFRAKGHIVSGAVAAIADSLRSRGLEIGMDLYAPFMAPFVGQDYAILAQHADFIKPMLYRKTTAPAGMGFEYELLRKAVPGATGYPTFEMDAAFLESQLDAMAPYPCGKYPGIEINFRAGVAETTPEYVTESLDAVMRHGFDGAVLSWDIMEAPDAHIDCLGKSDRTKGQLLEVYDVHGSEAKARLTVNGKVVFTTDVYVGRNGLGKTGEGDGKTPVGTLRPLTAFGIKPDPGTAMPYLDVTPTVFACDEDCEYYNRIIDTAAVGHDCKGEEMYALQPDYNYGIATDFNKECVYPDGSNIFIHVKGPKTSTAGCIAFDEERMVDILRNCDLSLVISIKD